MGAQFGASRRGRAMGLALTIFILSLAVGLALLYSSGVIGIEDTYIFALFAALLLLPIVFIDPIHGLMVYAIVAPISPEIPVADVPIRVQDPLIVLVIVGVVLRQLRYGSLGPPIRLKTPLLIYAAFAVVSTAIAPFHSPLSKDPNWAYVLKLIQLVAIALCAAHSIRSPRQVAMLVTAIAFGLALQFTRLEAPSDYGGVRLHGVGISEQANVLACYVVMAVSILLGCFDRLRTPAVRFLLLATIVAACFVILETKSRTGYISLGAAVLTLLFFARTRWMAGVILIGAVIALILRPDFLDRAETIGAVVGIGEDSSYSSRIQAYGMITERITHAIGTTLVGGGRGTYGLAFADTQWGIEIFYAGAIGLAVFIALVLACLRRAYDLWKATQDRNDIVGAVGLGGLVAMVAATISCFGLTSWSAIRTGEIIFLIIGLIAGCLRIVESEKRVVNLGSGGIQSRSFGPLLR